MKKEKLEEIIKHQNEIIESFNQQKESLREWLKSEIDRISKLCNSKPKPYGEELHLHENAISRYRQVLSKIEELEKGKK